MDTRRSNRTRNRTKVKKAVDNLEVEVYIRKMPLNVYLTLRKQLQEQGYEAQAYQIGYNQRLRGEEINLDEQSST